MVAKTTRVSQMVSSRASLYFFLYKWSILDVTKKATQQLTIHPFVAMACHNTGPRGNFCVQACWKAHVRSALLSWLSAMISLTGVKRGHSTCEFLGTFNWLWTVLFRFTTQVSLRLHIVHQLTAHIWFSLLLNMY